MNKNNSENFRKDIFICHASEDKEGIVRPLYKDLGSSGFEIWYDEAEINWGDSITQKINWGLLHSKYVIVVLSENFLAKNWPNRELNSVINIEASKGEVKVLPLLVGGEDSIKKIVSTYPLLNDKKFLLWNGGSREVVSELKKLFPHRRKNPYVEIKDDIDIQKPIPGFEDFIRDPEILISIKTLESLKKPDLNDGVIIYPESINGINFDLTINSLIKNDKGGSIFIRYLQKSIWKARDFILESNPVSDIFLVLSNVFYKTDLIESVLKNLIYDSDLKINNFRLLVPEPVLMNEPDESLKRICKLSDAGFKMGISRFGTGHSSLSYMD